MSKWDNLAEAAKEMKALCKKYDITIITAQQAPKFDGWGPPSAYPLSFMHPPIVLVDYADILKPRRADMLQQAGEPVIHDIDRTVIIHGRDRKGRPFVTLTIVVGTIKSEGNMNSAKRTVEGPDGPPRTVKTNVPHNRTDKLAVFGITQCNKDEDRFSKEYGRRESLNRAMDMAKVLRDYPGRPRDEYFYNRMVGHAPCYEDVDACIDYIIIKFRKDFHIKKSKLYGWAARR